MKIIATWLEHLMSQRRLSPGTKSVLKAIANDPEMASYCSAAALAEVAGVNVATVVRAAQAIDFTGWSELSTEIRNRFLSSLDADKHFVRNTEAGMGQPATSIGKDIELLGLLAESLSEDSVTTIATMVTTAPTTTILATGAYVAPGTILAHNAQGLGYDVSLSDGAATRMINDVRKLKPGDCLITFSIWKTSASILPLCEIAKERGVQLIVIADQHSQLAELADQLILVPSEGLGPMASVTCAVSVAQCIVRAIANVDTTRSAAMLEELQAMWSRTQAVISD
ncbi:MurR/RpiR family transcriptional regulator [Brevibacterium sediminis]|uniref:MurR/RpiR family transcriptional regulator n=1 Tax=Brevibacterium sediminis TaxID=1857024 RepID=UPI00217535AB|nr:MurR/RpiR family transcriptional regulator [Brevibacterium sediminis]MCS4594790.1 MurR/RpiR family transcriptional regulator [Brevibacterium sediminis]